MSADRENHLMTDMTQTDLALLLADAADGVEIGTAPVQAVIRGGRRRRARRWAMATTTALVLAGSAGATLAVAGVPGGHGDAGRPVATRPSAPEARYVYEPQVTELARGTDHGTRWRVVVAVWGAPRDGTEAAVQRSAMRKFGIESHGLPDSPHLVGKTSYYSGLYYGDHPFRAMIFNTVEKWEALTGKDMMSGAVPLAAADTDGPERLVVGTVALTARQVECGWKDGTSTVVEPQAVAGSPVEWFACTAPAGTAYQGAEVIR
ncbi:hypothetical protein AB0N17_29805 [Streptomyces sp. NPDC051133]|uniref:hypothetical protein n=1 Tax=Streptomyces sp. NPDC051133 TaxID=3155521 RepID=UPI00343A1E21